MLLPPLEKLISTMPIGSPEIVPEIRLHFAPASAGFDEFRDSIGGLAGPGVPYWARAWPGGQALARFILDNPQAVEGRDTLDAGCGSGLAAIAALIAGARSATAIDRDRVAVAAAQLNARLNGVVITARVCDIGDVTVSPGTIVLAGDLWYDRIDAARGTAWLRHAARQSATVFCGDCQRSYFPKFGLDRIAAYELRCDTAFERSRFITCGVWKMVDAHPSIACPS